MVIWICGLHIPHYRNRRTIARMPRSLERVHRTWFSPSSPPIKRYSLGPFEQANVIVSIPEAKAHVGISCCVAATFDSP